MTQDQTMKTMLLERPGTPLRLAHLAIPTPGDNDLLIKIGACGVCRTDLHISEGDLAPHRLPLVLGHEVVGTIIKVGQSVDRFAIGERVGVPWLAGTCGHCSFCGTGRENLCDTPEFTGYDRHGGYAEYAVADARYCLRLPDRYDDVHAAPLLCAGLIGYRALRTAGSPKHLGLYGFGASAHIITQVAGQQGVDVYAFTRPGDTRSQAFALSLGAAWAGDCDATAPVRLEAAIIFAPDGGLVPRALSATAKGATIICAGIHMSDIPRFPYSLLWGERVIRSIANLTREDGEKFFSIADELDIKTSPVTFPLLAANEALDSLKQGRIEGAAVLVPERDE